MQNVGEKVSAIWITLIIFIALYLIGKVIWSDTEEIRPEVEPIPEEVTVVEREEITPPPLTREVVKKEEVIEKEIDPYELDILAKVIQSEAGYCSRELKEYVGSVVINRVNSPRFPNSIEGVIFQKNPIQYSTAERLDTITPTKESIEVAEYLLKNGSVIPSKIIWQSNFKQGSTYKIIEGVYFGY